MTTRSLEGTLLAGAAAGFAGSLAMNLMSYLWGRAEGKPGSDVIVQHGTRPEVAAAQEIHSSRDPDVATTRVAALMPSVSLQLTRSI